MRLLANLGQFGGWASNVVQKAAPLASMLPIPGAQYIGLAGTLLGGGGGARPPASTSMQLSTSGTTDFARLGQNLPNLGIYTPPGGLPKPTGSGGGGVPVVEASIVTGGAALMRALSPAARALARRGVPWLRANWKWLASVVGTQLLTELGQWMLASQAKAPRRMNVLNPRALRRALRRTHGFANYAKRSITLERRGYRGVKFKTGRRKAA